ncbi:MAG: Gfo/Idh/MocA family protein [Nitrospirales bacterium]
MSTADLQQNVADYDEREPPIRIGLVGCGRLAEAGYVRAFHEAAGVSLVGVADINQSRCHDIAPQVPAYDGIQPLIQAENIDALIIATPTRCHLADAQRAARDHLPTLLEKPPGIDLSQAQALLNLTPQPWIAFNRRFDPELIRIKNGLPGEGTLCLRLELHYRRKSWNPFDMSDDALLDLGPHLIDLAQWLTNSHIRSVIGLRLEQDRAEFALELERGNAMIVCSSNSPYREVAQVRLNDGSLAGSFTRGGIVAGIIGKLRPTQKNPLVNSLVGELEAFAQAVRNNTSATSLGTVRDGVVVMSVIEAVRQSVKQGGVRCSVLEN